MFLSVGYSRSLNASLCQGRKFTSVILRRTIYPIAYCNGWLVGMEYDGGYPIVYCNGWSVGMEYDGGYPAAYCNA